MGGEVFRDRRDAGRQLALRLDDLAGRDAVVLALPRGGVPVAAQIATRIAADLDVLVVRKLSAPAQPELAVGAVAADGTLSVNERIADIVGIDTRALEAEAAAIAPQLAGKAARFRAGRPPVPVRGRVAVVVDDGVATGASLRAALELVAAEEPRELVVAVPVAPPQACALLAATADRVECLHQPPHFVAVGHWYHDFTQVTDEQVVELLGELSARRRARPGRARGDSG
jgi:predicted phosphoribosyltransferase